MSDKAPLTLLLEHGYLRLEGDRYRTTARWQAALARAALRLQQAGAPWRGLGLPVAAALTERHAALSDDALADLVEQMVRIEEAELRPVLDQPAQDP